MSASTIGQNNRLEDFLAACSSLPERITLRLGMLRNGLIVAKDVLILADCGAYAGLCSEIMHVTAMRSDNMHLLENVRCHAKLAYTHNSPHGAFGGVGGTQMLFALNSHIDTMARQLRLYPVDVHKMNEDSRVVLHTAEGDMGQGSQTMLSQIVAHELKLPLNHVQVALPDADAAPYAIGYIWLVCAQDPSRPLVGSVWSESNQTSPRRNERSTNCGCRCVAGQLARDHGAAPHSEQPDPSRATSSGRSLARWRRIAFVVAKSVWSRASQCHCGGLASPRWQPFASPVACAPTRSLPSLVESI